MFINKKSDSEQNREVELKYLKLAFFIAMMLLPFLYNDAISQTDNMGIGTTTPDNSALLDLDVSTMATKRGFLAPRMTSAQKTAISSPATGLLIYQTDGTQGFYYYNGSVWKFILTTGASVAFSTLTSGTNNSAAMVVADGASIALAAGFSTAYIQSNRFTGTGSTSDAVDLATSEVNGLLPIANGGTNSNTTPTAGSLAYGSGTSYAFTTVGSSGDILQSNGAAAPSWINPSSLISDNAWSLTGNANTVITSNYLGTSDAKPLSIRTNGTDRIRILSSGNVGIGDASPTSLLTVGSGDAFQINSTGAIVAATGIASSGAITFSSNTITFSGFTPNQYLKTDVGGLLTTGAVTIADLTLSDGKILIGDASNQAAEATISQDASITNTGVLTVTGLQGLAIESPLNPTNNQVLKWKTASNSWEAAGDANSGGTVTSIGLSMPTELTITGSPVTTTGTISATWTNQGTGNLVFATPTGGGVPAFRALASTDMPVGTITGSGTADQVTYWNGANTLTGSTNYTWTNATNFLNLKGTLSLINSGNYYSNLVSSNSQATNITYTLPDATPATTGYLQSDNSGNLSWVNLSFPSGTTNQTLRFNNAGTLVASNFLINTTARIGIGDTGPDAVLEVSASGGTDDLLMLSSDANNDGDRLIIKNDGKTGLGIKTPQVKLHQDDGNATATYHKFTAGTTTGTNSSDGFDLGIDANGNAEINQRENLPIKFYTNNAERMRILEDGKIGFGVTSPSSTYTYEFNGSMKISGDLEVTGNIDPISIFMVPQNSAPTGVKGRFYFDNTSNKLRVYDGSAWQDAGGSSLPTGTSGQTIRSDGTDWLASSTLYNDGTNIGINTTSTNEKLTLDGSVSLKEQASAPSSTASHGKLYVKSDDSQLWFEDDGGTKAQLSYEYAIYEDQEAAATDGGTFTSGAWQTRTLNTTVASKGSSISKSGNVITLNTGTYRVIASAPAYKVNFHQARFRKTSATASTVLLGSAERADALVDDVTRSFVDGIFDVSSDGTTFELQHRCETSNAGDGFGAGSPIAWDEYEVYARVYIQKIK